MKTHRLHMAAVIPRAGQIWRGQRFVRQLRKQLNPEVQRSNPTPWPQRPASQRHALITLSGQARVSPGTDLWNAIAQVMKEVNANIEDAAGTFMNASFSEPSDLRLIKNTKRSPRFLVSAFNTHIAPFSPAHLQIANPDRQSGCGFWREENSGDEVALACLLKASVREDRVSEMSDLFHTRFPGLVCTVTVGGTSTRASSELLGTIRLFGVDQAGQLAKIAQVLHGCRVTILNLLVTTGYCDTETCEFLERQGGGLSENVLTVAAIDPATFDEETFRKEVAGTAQEVGYHVTSIILESEKNRAQQLARYYLRRKNFMNQIAGAMDFSGGNVEMALWSL